MTNVLIPTDFTAASLRTIEPLLRSHKLRKCNIILFHAFELPDSPFDLLATSHRDPAVELMNEPFRQACRQVKEQFPNSVGRVVVRCMKGSTQVLFRNFVEANDVDLIFCPEDYVHTKVHARSVHPAGLFEKSGVPVLDTTRIAETSEISTPVLQALRLSTT